MTAAQLTALADAHVDAHSPDGPAKTTGTRPADPAGLLRLAAMQAD